MSDFHEYSSALAARDTIKRLALDAVNAERPKYKYATVVSTDPVNKLASVVFNGESDAHNVAYARVAPNVGDTARVGGLPGDRFIEDSFGGVGNGLIYADAYLTPVTFPTIQYATMVPINDPGFGVFASSGTDLVIPVTGLYTIEARVVLSATGVSAVTSQSRTCQLYVNGSNLLETEGMSFPAGSWNSTTWYAQFSFSCRFSQGDYLNFYCTFTGTTTGTKTITGHTSGFGPDISLRQIW